MTKQFTGEKHAYFSMAYQLAEANNGYVKIGNDNGMVKGYLYERRFSISRFEGKTILTETKSTPHCADFSRYVEIKDYNPVGKIGRLVIYPYINDDGEDGYKTWVH
jgi:hypothetical protein